MGFGTDLLGPAQVQQCREFEIRAEVISPLELVRSATTINAELLNQTGKLGIVKAGSIADLILVEGNPLEDSSVLAQPEVHLKLVMKDGEIAHNWR